MFLPIILLRDFGWPGFLVFAVPNVLGCAAFGYVLRDAGRRADLLRRHERAAVLFSATTIAYHMFFMAFLATMVARGASQALLTDSVTPACRSLSCSSLRSRYASTHAAMWPSTRSWFQR